MNTSLKFNHCSILVYYAGAELKSESTLGMYYDCVYSINDGSFTTNANSQVENTPTVIYSLGDSRTLKWRKGYAKQMNRTHKRWVNDENYKVLFTLDSDSVCVFNPLD